MVSEVWVLVFSVGVAVSLGSSWVLVGLLALVAGQDVEPAEGSDGRDGRWRIAQRTAHDRIVSSVALADNHPCCSEPMSEIRPVAHRVADCGNSTWLAGAVPWRSAVLLRLASLGVANTFALLRLLPMSDRDKDAQILALRHQLAVLQRQLGPQRARFTPSDRALLAALLHRLPGNVLTHLHLAVKPDTVPHWHRDLAARRHAEHSRPKRPGRPRTAHSVRALILRLVRENPQCGYRRVHGELLALRVQVAASTAWEILKDAGIDPAPQRGSTTWATFLRSQANALLACDFFETITPSGTRLYVFAVSEHASRRNRALGATTHPTATWVTQAARNLTMDLQDAGTRARFLIRDHDRKVPALFDQILANEGIEVMLSGIRMPRMNSIMERWVQTCRHEPPDRTLIWNQAHLPHALREFEHSYNTHRPHQDIANARPLHPLPAPLTDPDRITRRDIRRRDRLGGILHEYEHAA